MCMLVKFEVPGGFKNWYCRSGKIRTRWSERNNWRNKLADEYLDIFLVFIFLGTELN